MSDANNPQTIGGIRLYHGTGQCTLTQCRSNTVSYIRLHTRNTRWT
jgi:hypothetical protein